MLIVNLLAAFSVAAMLIGATAILVWSRKAHSFVDEVFPLVGYGAGLLAGFGLAFFAGRFLSRVATRRILVVVAVISAICSAMLLLEISFSSWEKLLSSWPENISGVLGGCLVGLCIASVILILGRQFMAGQQSNVINLITSISAFGLGVGAAAVILVLSVFNGFEEVIGDMFGKFNPAVKVMPARGKTFSVDSFPLQRVLELAEVEATSYSLEETAFFEYGDSRVFGKLKGVDSNYTLVSSIDSTLIEGSFATKTAGRALGILGLGLRNKLAVNAGDAFEPVQVYAAKRQQVGPLDKPFRVRSVYPTGTFAIQQEYDQQYLFTDIDLVRELLDLPDGASSLEISLSRGSNPQRVADAIQVVLGPKYLVLDRMEQDADLLRLMNIEKWLSYVILSLVLLLISFNLIGGLWLIVIEKQRDIAILRAMGTPTGQIRGIFLGVGLLLSLMGVLIGLGLALLLYYLQVDFNLVTVPQGLIVSAYPIDMRLLDVMVVIATVLVIGLLASLPAARRAVKIDASSKV